MKTLPDTVRPVPAPREETVGGLSTVENVYEAGLRRHARLLATAPIVRHQNQLWAHKWEIVRTLAERGPRTADDILRSNTIDGEAALEALIREGLVCVSGQADPRSRLVTLTLRGKTVLDTIRPPAE